MAYPGPEKRGVRRAARVIGTEITGAGGTAQAASEVDRERESKRLEPDRFPRPGKLLIERIEGRARRGVGSTAALEMGRPRTVVAAHAKEIFRARVVGFEVFVLEGPLPDRAGNPIAVMAPRQKILPRGSQQRGAVERAPASGHSADQRTDALAVDLDRAVVGGDPLNQHLLLVLALACVCERDPALDDERSQASVRQRRRGGAAAGPGSDDDGVVVGDEVASS